MNKRANVELPIRTLRAIAEAIGLDCAKHRVVAIDIHADVKELASVAVTMRMDVDGRGKLCDVVRRYRLMEDGGEGVGMTDAEAPGPRPFTADDLRMISHQEFRLYSTSADRRWVVLCGGKGHAAFVEVERDQARVEWPNGDEYRDSGVKLFDLERWDHVPSLGSPYGMPVGVEVEVEVGDMTAAPPEPLKELAAIFVSEHRYPDCDCIYMSVDGRALGHQPGCRHRVEPEAPKAPPDEKHEMEAFFFPKP